MLIPCTTELANDAERILIRENGVNVWKKINVNPLGIRTGDCVVRACAVATGQSWDQTYRELCDMGFQRKEMPSWNPTWWAYLKAKGFRRKIIPDLCPECYTVGQFALDHPNGAFVLYIPESSVGSGHAVAVKNGMVWDTWNSTGEIPLAYFERSVLL